MSKINILCIGDVVGRPGRTVLKKYLPDLQRRHNIHFTFLNAENAAGGFGVTNKVYHELKELNVQAFTSGNHIYDKREIIKTFDTMDMIIRPLNFPSTNPGKGYRIFNFNHYKIAVVNLIGRVFMNLYDNPFEIIEAQLPEIKAQSDIILVDMHAEATSEKIAMGWYLDGKVAAVVGTHTHVQTADDRVLDNGTAYISDIGLVGAMDGVLGMEREPIIHKFFTNMPVKFEPSKLPKTVIHAVKIEVDPDTGIASSIERIQEVYHA